MDDRSILDRVLGRRFLVIVAVLMGLTALAASLAPQDPRVRDRGAATPAPTAEPLPEPAPRTSEEGDADVVETLDAGGEPRRIDVEVGQRVAILVESDEIGSVALGELEVDAVDPDAPARFELRAEEPGSHPITLLDSEERIGVLRIRE